MAEKNATIINRIYLAASDDYQQRISDVTQQGVARVMDDLFSPMNKMFLDEFMGILVNQIAIVNVKNKLWNNPLREFFGEDIRYGSGVEEVALKWLRAHSYSDESETLLKMERPDGRTAFHTINRRDRYDISVTYDELRSAFRNEESGLSQLIDAIMTLPVNSSRYDEYRIMLATIAYYYENWGMYTHRLSGTLDNETVAKELLTAIRSYAMKLTFPSTTYSALSVNDIPTFANPEELVFITTPDVSAYLDVNVLASVFHTELADIRYRIMIVDEFPIPDCVGILTTHDFIIAHDVLYTNRSFDNPETLTTKYYHHVWQVLSNSPFVPCIMFSTADDATVIPTVTMTPSGITLADIADVVPGGKTKVTVTLNGNISGDTFNSVELRPDAYTWELSAGMPGTEPDADATPIDLDVRTYIDDHGYLHVADDVPVGANITVTVTSAYYNPSGDTSAYTATKTCKVVANLV